MLQQQQPSSLAPLNILFTLYGYTFCRHPCPRVQRAAWKRMARPVVDCSHYHPHRCRVDALGAVMSDRRKPIKCNGMLGLWTIPPNVLRSMKRQLPKRYFSKD